MSFTNRSKSSTTFANRAQVSGFATVGDLPVSYFATLTFDDIVVGSNGKTLGELKFTDIISFDIFGYRAKNATTFVSRTKH